MMENPEKIRDRLLKLKELAERGCRGEAVAAELALKRLLEKYNLTPENLALEEKKWRWINPGRGKYAKQLLFQCCYNVLNVCELEVKRYKNEIGLELAAYEYAELMNVYEWHKKNFDLEKKKLEEDLFEAYLYKHDIYSHTDNDLEGNENDNVDLESISRILRLAANLKDVTYRKQLNG
jgi:hypothetical protein